ncbi:MAG: hypothetical protein AAF089_03130 [Bacteroidota bacterium]
MNVRPAWIVPSLSLGLLALLAVCIPTASAQDTLLGTPAAYTEALHSAQRAHLWRVGAWGSANALGGMAQLLASSRSEQPGRFGAGVQLAAWGTINVGIAALGLLSGGPDTAATWAEALRAENNYADILLFNLGLNVAYSAVGATLAAVSYRGVDGNLSVRGHGAALILQGLGLFVLDGIAYLDTRGRWGALVEQVAVHVGPTGAGLTFSF